MAIVVMLASGAACTTTQVDDSGNPTLDPNASRLYASAADSIDRMALITGIDDLYFFSEIPDSNVVKVDTAYSDENITDERGNAEAAIRVGLSLDKDEGDPLGSTDNYLFDAAFTAQKGHIAFLDQDIESASEYWQEAYEIRYRGAMAAQKRANEANQKLGWAVAGLAVVGAYADLQQASEGYGTGTQHTQIMLSLADDLGLMDPPPRVDPRTRREGTPDGHIVRVPVTADGAPFNQIGRLHLGRSGHCTAFIVARGFAMTNLHCVVDRQRERIMNPEQMLLSFERLPVHESYPIVDFYTAEGWYSEGIRSGRWMHRSRNDWAILELGNPKNLEGDPPLDVYRNMPHIDSTMFADPKWESTEPGKTNLFLAGYSADADRGRFMTLHYGCAISPQANPESIVVKSSCDTWGGSSGAPVIAFDEDTGLYRIVAMHSASMKSPEEVETGVRDYTREPIRPEYRSIEIAAREWYPALHDVLQERGGMEYRNYTPLTKITFR